jgi:3-oxoacyl-[acyl-carrier-protein] synthase II
VSRKEEVYVSGMGVATSAGIGVSDFWEAVLSGKSGIGPITRFDTQWMPRHLAGEIKELERLPHLSPTEAKSLNPINLLALSCARAALADAKLLDRDGCAVYSNMELYLGTIHGDVGDHIQQGKALWKTQDHEHWLHLAHRIMTDNVSFGFLLQTAQILGITGMQSINTNACTASGYAICTGIERIRQGYTDIAVCGGMDLLSEAEIAGFCSLRAMAAERCAPFDVNRDGVIISEGGGALILESGTSLRRRGRKAWAKVLGYGFSNDAHHLSVPHPEGRGTVRSISGALQDAQLDPETIDFVVAHGTGTLWNDRVEAQAIRTVFQEYNVPVTAPKSILGHCMGGASAVEAMVGILAMQKHKIPFTLNHTECDPECPIQVVHGKVLSKPAKICLTNSAAFGGNNDSLIFSQAEDEVRRNV